MSGEGRWEGRRKPPQVKTRGDWAKIDAHLRKNRLKRPKIKQGTTSKVNCILFNRLLRLSPVLLNKSGLVRANAGNFNLKSLNRCFSNYYQVRTWPVFTETVTYVLGNMLKFNRIVILKHYRVCSYVCSTIMSPISTYYFSLVNFLTSCTMCTFLNILYLLKFQ